MEIHKDVMLRFSWCSQVLFFVSVGELYCSAKRSVEQSRSKKFGLILIYWELMMDPFIKRDKIFPTVSIFI